jgi:DNA repair protein RecO (recombination protein O)
MLIKTKGIVFRVVKYGETSVICDIYTAERGLQSYIINSVRTKKPKFHAGLLQVMSIVEMVAYAKEEKSLQYIKELKASYVYQTIPFQVLKRSIGLFMVELAQKTIKEAEANPSLFQFLEDIFMYLDHTTDVINNLHLWFAVQLTTFLGFLPDGIEDVKNIAFFDLKEGVYCVSPPPHGHFMATEQAHFLYQFLNCGIEDAQKINITAADRRLFIKNMINYYQLHVPNFVELKSFQVLQEVLG